MSNSSPASRVAVAQAVSGGVMQATVLPARCVVYVMDAYCGWCWGFSARIVEFEAANRHRVPFTAISGGLFTGQRARPISAYPHIPEANARIARGIGNSNPFLSSLKAAEWRCDRSGGSAPCLPR
jgi:hypothetical protein